MSSNRWGFSLACAIAVGLFASATTARAATINKDNNTTALNLGGSWVLGTAPGASDEARWEATVAGANSSALGGNLSWQGIIVTNPGGAITVTHASGNVLTLGSSGIDMSAATQNLTLLNTANTAVDVAIGANQTWNVASGRTLQFFSNSNTQNQRLTGSGNIEVTGGGIVRMLVGDAGSITFAPGNGNDTYSGNWTITNGSVRNLRNGTHAWGTGTVFLNGGTVGQEQGNWTWTNPFTLNTATTATFDDFNASGTTRALKLQGLISGSGNVNFNDSSNRMNPDNGYVLTGTNTLNGTVTLGANADVRIGGVPGNDTALGAGSSGTLGTASVNLSAATSTLTLSRDNTWTFANDVSGSGVLRIGLNTGSATHIVTVSGNNSHAGGTTLQSAVSLLIGSNNALGTGTFTIAGNGNFDNVTGGALTVANALTMSGGSPTFLGTDDMTINGAGLISGANRTITVNANTLTLGGALGQDVAGRNFTKQGAGTLAFRGANTYTGTTTVGGGTLDITGTGRIYATGGFFGAASTTNVFVNSGNRLVVDRYDYGAANSFSEMRNNYYAISINGGTLRVEGTNSSLRAFQIGTGGATLEVPTGSTFTKLAGTLGSENIIHNTGNHSLTLTGGGTGAIQDALGVQGTWTSANLIKNGSGTWTLSGANTYGGTTAVNDGNLLVNGTHTGGGAYTVAAIGTLGGTGSIGTSTFNINGTLAPGNSIESLLGGELNLNTGSTFDYELNSSVLNGDLLRAGGALNLTGTVTLALSEEASGTLPVGSKLTLINYSGAWNSGTFNGYADDSTFVLGANTWQINYNDTTGGSNFVGDQTLANFVTITVVPEPSALILFGLGLLALRFVRRR